MALSKTVETVEARATDFDNRLRHFKETLREVPNRKKGITASSWGQKTKEVAPRARFELATLRLTAEVCRTLNALFGVAYGEGR